ncbi:sodium-coupled monocarboxylate transporter 1-like isoform X2 [Drosophila takahashii]|uniref:sodium-coupled monocarboxylate transporter 1-like isoform X2 n=1 Tax=Drosophila takahashii TaxID=29030 RepID=UPI001CF8FB7D|nr:sodium-coupled monocarboxylate transporter 1-like isoform X2 [Drosophila takahashii]
MDNYRFGVVDYTVFMGMTIISIITGLYYGWIKKTKKNAELTQPTVDSPEKFMSTLGSKKMNEYFMGSGNLKVVPVGMSLIASFIAGITLLGTPSEIYYYGTQYWLIIIAIIIQGFIVSYIYLPVFSALQVHSSYEYLEMRFHSIIRSIASILFVIEVVLYTPFVVFVPALALNQVTGINIYLIEVVTIVVCVIYTLLGGLKAVVHTDIWQVAIMFLSVLVVAILATCSISDLDNLFEELEEGGRLIFGNVNPSPYVRNTVWSVLIGGTFYWGSVNAVNQAMVHRYMSLPSLKMARASIAFFVIGSVIFYSVLCFLGLLIFHMYKDCDPLSAGHIMNNDQLVPLFVVQSVGHIYGIPGLFIAGIFGAGLSSLSVLLNSTSLVLLQDIVRGCFKMQPGEKASAIFVKSSIVVMGAIAFALVFVIEKVSGVLSICMSLVAIATSSTFGIFTLGMLVPWANTVGTLVGGITGFLLTGWITFGSQVAAASGQLNSQILPVSVEGCLGNVTLPEKVWVDEKEVFPLYRLSFHWINPIGVLTVVVVGSLVSLVTKPTDIKTLDSKLMSPVIHRFLPKECFKRHEKSAKDTSSIS